MGISLKDHTLCFCDSQDNFKFQKRFAVTYLQNSIWYLDFF